VCVYAAPRIARVTPRLELPLSTVAASPFFRAHHSVWCPPPHPSPPFHLQTHTESTPGASATTPDFVVLDTGSGDVIVLSSQGAGQPVVSTVVANGVTSAQVADVIDLDGDGDSDVVTATQNGLAPNLVLLLVNEGSGSWTKVTLLSQAGSIFSSLRFMDVTGTQGGGGGGWCMQGSVWEERTKRAVW
jgi:hypothetical protein